VCSLDNLSKDHVITIKPWTFHQCYIELGPVRVWISEIGHSKFKRFVMFVIKVLIFEMLSVDRVSTSSISVSEITSLHHKMWNYPVEVVSFVMEFHFVLIKAFFSSDKAAEVCCSLWTVVIEFELDSTKIVSLNRDIDIDVRLRCHWIIRTFWTLISLYIWWWTRIQCTFWTIISFYIRLWSRMPCTFLTLITCYIW